LAQTKPVGLETEFTNLLRKVYLYNGGVSEISLIKIQVKVLCK